MKNKPKAKENGIQNRETISYNLYICLIVIYIHKVDID